MTPTPPHDVPSAPELLAAVHEFLESEIVPQLEGRRRFHALVAANVIEMVRREITLGSEQAAAHAGRLAQLGVHDEAELAEAIRSGRFEGRLDEVRELVRETVADKLRVANPSYHEPSEGPER